MKDYAFHLANTSEMRRLPERFHICPQCGRREYKVYVNDKCEPIHESVGRCNREVRCAYHLPPKEWFRMNPQDKEDYMKRAANAPKREPLKMVEIQREVVLECFKKERREKNTLFGFLVQCGIEEKKLLKQWMMYCTGTTVPHGNTIWWQIDEDGRVRSGKIMQYFANGSRKDNEGKPGYTNWIHSLLGKVGKIDLNTHGYVGCMFGQHLLAVTDPQTVPNVNIVESEKSALMASVYGREDEIWLAVGSITSMNIHTLSPIIRQGRNIMLYPDHDGYERWKQKAEEIKRQYPKICVSDYVERAWQPGMKPTTDIADIILHRLKESPQARLERMRRDNPEIDNLINELGLEPIV